MGRMLEALKRTEEPKPAAPSVLAAVCPDPVPDEAAGDEEMPFVEVGGGRKQVESKLRLEVPAPRLASLHVAAPQGAVLHACSPLAPPKTRVAAELIAFHQPDHAVSLQYGSLFDQLTSGLTDDAAGVLFFSGLVQGVGATTAVLNIAVAGCRKNAQRIIVVDANFCRPAAAARLGVNATEGLRDVLAGKIALEQAVCATAVDNLHVLAAGADPAKMLGSADGVRWLLDCLRQRFDLIFVDGPPCGDGSPLQSVLPAASVVYLVVDAAETEQPAVRAATRTIARLGSRVGGLIAVA